MELSDGAVELYQQYYDRLEKAMKCDAVIGAGEKVLVGRIGRHPY